jgi:ankyrin repeat protein
MSPGVPNKCRSCHQVSDGDIEIVKKLLDCRPDLVQFKDEEGRTGLHWASDGGNLELVELFLKFGADPNAQVVCIVSQTYLVG